MGKWGKTGFERKKIQCVLFWYCTRAFEQEAGGISLQKKEYRNTTRVIMRYKKSIVDGAALGIKGSMCACKRFFCIYEMVSFWRGEYGESLKIGCNVNVFKLESR